MAPIPGRVISLSSAGLRLNAGSIVIDVAKGGNGNAALLTVKMPKHYQYEISGLSMAPNVLSTCPYFGF
jgi:hypothetical protein